MILLVASRVLDWFHLQPKHAPAFSVSSPKEEYVLPMSASAHQTVFQDAQNEKSTFSPSSPRWSSVSLK
jgi:hypothetical protein